MSNAGCNGHALKEWKREYLERIAAALERIATATERANAMRPSPIVSPPVFPPPSEIFPSTYPPTPNWPRTGGSWCQVPPGAHQRISDDVIDRPEEHPIKSSDLTGPAC